MKLTTLIITDEDSYVIIKRVLLQTAKEVLERENVVINLINRFKNYELQLSYTAEKKIKRINFRVIDDLRSYVMINASDQNSIFIKNLTDENITSQSVIQT